MALRLIGGWGDRIDDLQSCAERLQNSLELTPQEHDVYGGWGVWQPQDPPSKYLDLIPLDLDDVEAVKKEIAAVTERINGAPRKMPGLDIDIARERIGPTAIERRFFEYKVRAGFIGYPDPFNHLLLRLVDRTAESLLSRYLSALVVAWQPDHLSVSERETQRAQGHVPPEAVVGWLTYLRDGTPFDTAALDDQISVVTADGGVYVSVPGTPGNPSMDHVRQVRTALGYPNAE